MKRRFVLLVMAAAAACGGAVAVPAAPAVSLTPTAIAKACSSGWTHGVIRSEHKCLRAGQFCARRYDREYHRYGFHCHRFDASVARLRLTG